MDSVDAPKPELRPELYGFPYDRLYGLVFDHKLRRARYELSDARNGLNFVIECVFKMGEHIGTGVDPREALSRLYTMSNMCLGFANRADIRERLSDGRLIAFGRKASADGPWTVIPPDQACALQLRPRRSQPFDPWRADREEWFHPHVADCVGLPPEEAIFAYAPTSSLTLPCDCLRVEDLIGNEEMQGVWAKKQVDDGLLLRGEGGRLIRHELPSAQIADIPAAQRPPGAPKRGRPWKNPFTPEETKQILDCKTVEDALAEMEKKFENPKARFPRGLRDAVRKVFKQHDRI